MARGAHLATVCQAVLWKHEGMSIIHTVSEDDATGDVAALYAEDRGHFGYVLVTFAHGSRWM
jgi:hypothetical protein